MKKIISRSFKFFVLFFSSVLILSVCYGGGTPTDDTDSFPTQTAQAPLVVDLPTVTSVSVDREDVSKYESIEMTLDLDAIYSNPYDQREVEVNSVFYSPDGGQWTIPGFWDGNASWRIRFTPSKEGSWKYSIFVKDVSGTSEGYDGSFEVEPSDLHGWIIPGNSFSETYSLTILFIMMVLHFMGSATVKR